MSFAPSDQSDDASSDLAPASSEPIGSPPSVAVTPLSPEQAAWDNAHNGHWAMNEHFSGWVLLGADDRPVMRNDGSRVGFFFHDVERLGRELAESGRDAVLATAAPEEEAQAESRAKAWRTHRRALAPLEFGLQRGLGPAAYEVPARGQDQMDQAARLLLRADHRAGRGCAPRRLGAKLWVPGKYKTEDVESVARTLLIQVLGSERSIEGDVETSGLAPANRDFGQDNVISAVSDSQTGGTAQLAQASSDKAVARVGFNNQQIDNRFDRKQWNWIKNVDERSNTASFITTSDAIAVEASSISHPLTNQFYFKVFVIPLNEDKSTQASVATHRWFEPVEYSSGFTGLSYKLSTGQRVIQANSPGAKKFKWTIVLPPQESSHGNVVSNSNMLEVFTPNEAL